jgi:hypothetical protein
MSLPTEDILALIGSGAASAHASDPPNWAEIATACIAFLALVGAFIQLWSARAATRRRTAFSYFERWSDPGSLPYIAEMARLFKREPDQNDEARLSGWEEKPHEERLKSLLFVNFWEELGGLYNRRLVDREVVRQYLGAAVVLYWEKGQWFIDTCSKRTDSAHLFEEWRKMSENIELWRRERDHPKWRRQVRDWVSKKLLRWL